MLRNVTMSSPWDKIQKGKKPCTRWLAFKLQQPGHTKGYFFTLKISVALSVHKQRVSKIAQNLRNTLLSSFFNYK